MTAGAGLEVYATTSDKGKRHRALHILATSIHRGSPVQGWRFYANPITPAAHAPQRNIIKTSPLRKISLETAVRALRCNMSATTTPGAPFQRAHKKNRPK
ncbi:hypothetical protein [Pandoraea sp. SD6-2]|uniref:hypothetical protein n=1 Tax=Pandoraea sp. SD6-2 TaxID=1286093 RepID=UPI0011869F7E|nr:hypothetical protein [Pandoraea sp. SD6-2]